MTEEELVELLPQGSGIDGDWHIEEKPDRWIASNFYHAMDEMGGYDGYADFILDIPKEDPKGFKMHFNGKDAQRLNQKYVLRDYLEDTIAEALHDMPIESKSIKHKKPTAKKTKRSSSQMSLGGMRG